MNPQLFDDAELSAKYRSYRQVYPRELFEHIVHYYFDGIQKDASSKKIAFALDVGCGNGQATIDLSKYVTRLVLQKKVNNIISDNYTNNLLRYSPNVASFCSFNITEND